MLSSAKINNNINKQVIKKTTESQNYGLMIPGDFKGANIL